MCMELVMLHLPARNVWVIARAPPLASRAKSRAFCSCHGPCFSAVCHRDSRPCVPHGSPSTWVIPTPLCQPEWWDSIGGNGGSHLWARTLGNLGSTSPMGSPQCDSPTPDAQEQTLPLCFARSSPVAPVARAHALRGRQRPPSSFHFCALFWPLYSLRRLRRWCVWTWLGLT